MIFQRDDWTLFRNLGTLGQKAGVPRERLAALVVKELVDNALDAGGEVEVRQIPSGWIEVTDTGPGIDGSDEELASLFSIKRPLTSSKLFRLPTRGALGNGLRVVAGAVAASGGEMTVMTRGRELTLLPQDDGTTRAKTGFEAGRTVGTTVRIKLGPELASQPALYLANTAILLKGESRYEGKTSAHWYDSDSFFELCQAWSGDVRELVRNFRTTERAIPTPYLPMLTRSLSRSQCETILTMLRSKSAPKPAALGEVGQSSLAYDGYAKKSGTFEIKPGVGAYAAEIPFVVEVGASRSSDSSVQICINRTPITAKVGSGMEGGKSPRMWINGCGLNHYVKSGRHPLKMTIVVTTPYMPITTDGKEPNLLPILGVLVEAITAAARKAKRPGEERTSIKQLIEESLVDACDDASGGGQNRFSLRQLYYKVRPLVLGAGVDELSYTYFCQTITQIEAAQGNIEGMYRDARGQFVHPHTGETMSLGTLGVEAYKRPAYRFNKVLYIEKGGFFPLLADNKWAERWDCALLTSQGQATRAAKDLLDLLGDTAEELTFYCVTDADGFGGQIYQALTEATASRPGRRVRVVNLGLHPWEGREMDLEVEHFVKKTNAAVPVADHVYRYDRTHGTDYATWLQSNRYELNTMSSPQFLAWLDRKMAEAIEEDGAARKVVPPEEILQAKFRAGAHEAIRRSLIEEAIRALKIEEKAKEIADKLEIPDDLSDRVGEALRETPEDPWETPLDDEIGSFLQGKM